MALSAIRSTSNSGTANSYTLSILVDGSDPALCCATGAGSGAQAGRFATGVTWNTTENFTKKWEIDDGTWTGCQGWTLIPTATGTLNVVATFNGPIQSCAGVTLFNGVHQSVSFGTAASGAARDTANSVAISSAGGELVWTATATDDESGLTAGGTQLWAQTNVASDNTYAAQTYPGSATVTATWTQDILGWSSGGISLKPSVTGSIAFISSTGGTIATAASTWSMNSSALGLVDGGALIVGVGLGSTTVSVSTVTDNTTNTFLKAVANGTGLPTAARCELWYSNGISAASTRVSITLSGASSGSIGLAHFVGISTGTPLDVTGSSAIIANSTSHSASQITPTSNGALVISFARLNASTIGTVTTLGGMTRWISTNVAVRTVGQYIIQGAPSTVTGSFTTSSNCQHAAVIAAFNDTNAIAAGGGGIFWMPTFTLMGIQ